jgi:hypothetical protein
VTVNSRTQVSPELWRLRIPLSTTIGTPGRSFSHTHVLLALIRDSRDNCGMGYSRFFDAADVEPSVLAAQALLPGAASLADLLDIERTRRARGPRIYRGKPLGGQCAQHGRVGSLAGNAASHARSGRPAGRERSTATRALFPHPCMSLRRKLEAIGRGTIVK